jgi:hypothetical protein
MNPNVREPLQYCLSGNQLEQVAFLVEARYRSGYSGSPVFFLHQHAVNNSRAVLPQFDMRLLGIDFCHLPEEVTLKTEGNIPVKWKAEVHAGRYTLMVHPRFS